MNDLEHPFKEYALSIDYAGSENMWDNIIFDKSWTFDCDLNISYNSEEWEGGNVKPTIPTTEPVITLTSGHVKAENALYGTLIVSGYDKDGRLVKSEIIDGYESDLSGYYACKTLRAVLWSSTASMRPLTEAAVYRK